ncbi:hypothetical protein ASG54_23195 [Aureimonas sp. Leaf460]|nr:hypothetical protein ASG62_23925 [Aureimonas sp. Leaf427]KQT62218.1 hypothetical protein ASG54_23195 [Aureimonas sp. Leaf460]
MVGTVVPPGPGWTVHLADDAGGRFALDAGRIVVGPTALNRAEQPSPAILLAATDGRSARASRVAVDVMRPLPALPLAAGARLAAVGDSLIGYNNYGGVAIGSDKAAPSFAYGYVEQALAIDPRCDFDSWYDPADPNGRNLSGANHGIFGDHMDWTQPGFGGGILGRLPAVIARGPSLLLLGGGSNSINSGDLRGTATPASADYVIDRLDAALRLARSAGIPVVLATLCPRGDWPANDGRHRTLADVNIWIRAQASRAGIVGLCDPYALLAPNGILNPALYMADKTHLNPRGAFLVGWDHLLPILREAVSPRANPDPDAAIANLLPDSQAKLQGTNGIRLGSPIPSGSLAAGFSVQVIRNTGAIVCSKEIVSGNTEAQVLDITPADTSVPAFGQVEVMVPLVVLPSPTVGKWYRATLFVEIQGAEALSTARLSAALRTNGNSTNHAIAYAMSAFSPELGSPIAADRSFWIRTKPLQAPVEVVCDRLSVALSLYFAKGAGVFRVKLTRLAIRDVPDPRPAWGYQSIADRGSSPL